MELLESINNIYPIEISVQEAIQTVVKKRVIPKGTILLNEGQIAEDVHFIQKGLVRAFYYNGRKEITSWVANEGRFIWPLPSFLLRQPSRENIQVLEQATVFSINRKEVEWLKHSFDTFDNLQCKIMERYIVLYDLRIHILLLKADERFEAYQQLFPELYQRVPLRYIASYLGIDPATLSRLRASYKTKGLL